MNKKKELNNKHNMIIIHTSACGKENTLVLKVKRGRVYNQCLGVENSFSKETFPKSFIFPTNHSLVLAEFGQILDAIAHSSSPYP